MHHDSARTGKHRRGACVIPAGDRQGLDMPPPWCPPSEPGMGYWAGSLSRARGADSSASQTGLLSALLKEKKNNNTRGLYTA